MVHGEYLHFVWKKPIDDTVDLNDDLANIVTINLRNDPSHLGKIFQAVCCPKYPSGKQLRILWCITSNKQTYSLEIIQCLLRSTLREPLRHPLPGFVLRNFLLG